jgi:hypothetical protein
MSVFFGPTFTPKRRGSTDKARLRKPCATAIALAHAVGEHGSPSETFGEQGLVSLAVFFGQRRGIFCAKLFSIT